MSITAHKLCHHTCTKCNSSRPTRCGISCTDISHPQPLRR